MESDTISVAEASRLLGVRLDYVYRLLWDATLKGTKNEGVWRVRRESVRGYLEKRSGRRGMPTQQTAPAGRACP